jgi:hypothetical protein
MYDKHPKEEWKSQFKNRSLRAFSVDPPLLMPKYFIRDLEWVSDTELSGTVKEKIADEL